MSFSKEHNLIHNNYKPSSLMNRNVLDFLWSSNQVFSAVQGEVSFLKNADKSWAIGAQPFFVIYPLEH